MKPTIRNKRALAGIILVLAGSLLIVERTDLLPDIIPHWVFTWKFLIITIGVFSLLTSDHRQPGIILIVIGGIFIIPNIFAGTDIDPKILWYVAVVAIGLFLIFAGRRRHPVHRKKPADGQQEDDPDIIDEFTMFGGGEKICVSDNFKGGRITTIFGGYDIDFSKSKLAPGMHEIEVFALFGGWEIVVPPNWNIKTEVTSVLGGVSDKRQISSATLKDNTRTLVIKGFVMFGGGELKSFTG